MIRNHTDHRFPSNTLLLKLSLMAHHELRMSNFIGWSVMVIIREDGGVREFEFDDDQHQLLICPDMDIGEDST